MCHGGKHTECRRGGQISRAGLTVTVRTCVTPRKYLPVEHTAVTANIGSDRKRDLFLDLTAGGVFCERESMHVKSPQCDNH